MLALTARDCSFGISGSNHRDFSTCGLLHSIGSDLTRMKVRSDLDQNGSMQTVSKGKVPGNTPRSRAQASAVMSFSTLIVSLLILSTVSCTAYMDNR